MNEGNQHTEPFSFQPTGIHSWSDFEIDHKHYLQESNNLLSFFQNVEQLMNNQGINTEKNFELNIPDSSIIDSFEKKYQNSEGFFKSPSANQQDNLLTKTPVVSTQTWDRIISSTSKNLATSSLAITKQLKEFKPVTYLSEPLNTGDSAPRRENDEPPAFDATAMKYLEIEHLLDSLSRRTQTQNALFKQFNQKTPSAI